MSLLWILVIVLVLALLGGWTVWAAAEILQIVLAILIVALIVGAVTGRRVL